MPKRGKPRKQHLITWEQLQEFAVACGREKTHVYRVFSGDRPSAAIEAEFERHFGFPMRAAGFAGRKKAVKVAKVA